MTARGQDQDDADQESMAFGTGTTLLEWCMAAVGALVAVAMVVVLGANATTTGGDPAFRVEVVDVSAQASSHLVLVEVTNTGGSGASGVVVEGGLTIDGEVTTAQAELDHLPIGATRVLGLLFRDDPAAGSLEVHVLGFTM